MAPKAYSSGLNGEYINVLTTHLQEGTPAEAEGDGYFVPPNKGTSQATVRMTFHTFCVFIFYY